jgi:hypothetical protein
MASGIVYEKDEYDGIIKNYELIADFEAWINIKEYLVATEISNKGDVKNIPILSNAEKLGMSTL